MNKLTYSIEEYTLNKALLWGNCKEHIKAAQQTSNWKGRVVHALIAAVECLPLISQIASLFEMAVIKIFNAQNLSNPTSQPQLAKINYTRLPSPTTALTEEAMQKQEILDQRNLPLQINPPIPEKEYHVIDEVRADQWIKACEGEYQGLAAKVVNNIQHITFEQLEKELTECVKNLNKRLKAAKIKEYAVGLAIGKSQQWVASLATKDLDLLPSTHFTLGKQGTLINLSYRGANRFIPEQELEVSKIKEKALVIFDDCSFSGWQLVGNIRAIDGALKKQKNLYIVVPFMPAKIKDVLEKEKFNKLRVSVITSNTRIRQMEEIFSPDELKKVCKMLSKPEAVGNKTLCYTDWRLPDSTSTIIAEFFVSMTKEGVSKLAQAIKRLDIVRNKDYMYRFVHDTLIPRPYGLLQNKEE